MKSILIPILTCFCLLQFTHSSRCEELTVSQANTVGLQFVHVPHGKYKRGFEDNDRRENEFFQSHPYSNAQLFQYERPAHWVVLTKDFEIATTEVTVGQFRKFVQDTGYKTTAEQGEGALGFFPEEKKYTHKYHLDKSITWQSPGFEQSDDHPVVCVSWTDAKAFCKWLSTKEKKTYRLPTEAEWEYACKAGQEYWYSWGAEPDSAYEHANVADGSLEAKYPGMTSYQRAVKLKQQEGDGAVFTSKSGTYKPSPWGLYDMHGNVWEWCEDRWRADLYRQYFEGVDWPDRSKVTRTNPLFLEQTNQHQYGDWRSMRGGAWNCAPAACRNSIRTYAEANDATIYTGFRLVREFSESKQ